jgi:hypothetical protein
MRLSALIAYTMMTVKMHPGHKLKWHNGASSFLDLSAQKSSRYA